MLQANLRCRSHPRAVATRPTPAPAPTSLVEFLKSVEPNSSHLLFLFARNGLSNDGFADFVGLPPDDRKAFIRTVLHNGQVPDKYIRGVLTAIEKL